nr:uncharacterized protein LOC117273317 [Nicotiana tomentosiformis]
MVNNYMQWNEKLPFSLLGYRTTVRTSTGETPYLLVYGTEVVIPAEVEIPSFRIIQEALSDVEWIRSYYTTTQPFHGPHFCRTISLGVFTEGGSAADYVTTEQYMVPKKRARTGQRVNVTSGVAIDPIFDDAGEHPRGEDIPPVTTLPDSTTADKTAPIVASQAQISSVRPTSSSQRGESASSRVNKSHVLAYNTVQLDESLGYEKEPVAIVGRQVRQLKSKKISADLVLSRSDWDSMPGNRFVWCEACGEFLGAHARNIPHMRGSRCIARAADAEMAKVA